MKVLAPRTQVAFGDATIELYSIAWLAHLCNRTQRSLYVWEKRNILPSPIFDLNDGRRWYCAGELIGYSHLVRTLTPRNKKMGSLIDLKRLAEKLAQFHQALKKEIENTGKTVAELPDLAKFEKLVAHVRNQKRERKTSERAFRILKQFSDSGNKH